MTAFAAEWLQLREPFDAAARSKDLAARFGSAVAGRGVSSRRIVDLAAGSGAGFRALAPLIGGDQDWFLVDSDPALLALQSAGIARWSQRAGWRCRSAGAGVLVEGNGRWRARTVPIDLAQSLEELDIAAAGGITTSAFLDLVSATWLDRLCALLARHPRPFLAMLTVDGRRDWHPALPVDARINAAFASHQARDKGFGPALGTRSSSYLAARLAAHGYDVTTAASDWRIGAAHPEMLMRLARESAEVAQQADPAGAAVFTEWLEARAVQIRTHALSLVVGHVDLLALPE